MSEMKLSTPVAALIETRRISSEDVLMLRGETFRDGVVTSDEAEALFALHSSCIDQCPEWRDFFVEALTDYIVCQEKPAGYVSEENAAWLVNAVSRDGVVDTVVELELLVTVLEQAKSSPASLSAFTLEQVMLAVVDNKGPLAAAHATTPGVVSKAEVDLLRRILYAFGGDGNIAVTKAEAEVLFRINDGIWEESNDPSWNELFVKAIANFVLCSSGYEPPSRAEALRRDAFFEKADADIGRFFARMVSGGAAAILEAYAKPDGLEAEFEERNRANEAEAREAAAVGAEEARWLAEQIMKDRRIRDNERALLAFINQAATSVHPDLKPLLDKAG